MNHEVATPIWLLRDEALRHHERYSRYAYRALTLVAVFLILIGSPTGDPFKVFGLRIRHPQQVEMAIPPIIGYTLIQAMDALLIRNVYLLRIRGLPSAPNVPEAHISPSLWVSEELIPTQKGLAKLISHLDDVRDIGLFLLMLGFFLWVIKEIYDRFGLGPNHITADLSVAITAFLFARAFISLVAAERAQPTMSKPGDDSLPAAPAVEAQSDTTAEHAAGSG